ncbi:MAG TPA: hypothetical protein VN892_18440 [Solirubrobacteraceae bacterium]|nr:hypothetical protein [Solirubrobacteraceae bacterium]
MIETTDDASVRSVLIQAAAAMGIGLTEQTGSSWDRLWFVDLYRPEDDFNEYHGREWLRTIPLIDEEGHAYWGNVALDATLAQLERAAAAGAVEGDPRRLYLILAFPQGVPLADDWLTTLTAIKLAIDGLITVGGVYGGLQAVRAARSQCERGLQSLQRNWTRWVERKGAPRDVLCLAARTPHTTGEVADLLDCSEVDAEAVLAFLGCEQGADGLWRRSASTDARFLTDAAQFAMEVPALSQWSRLTDQEVADVMRRRAEALAEGQSANIDWSPWRTRPPQGLIDRPFGETENEDRPEGSK